MKIISIINYKGGVGKTTITANLAAYFTSIGKRVIAIDLDPQTNLTFSFIKPDIWEKEYAENRTIKNWLDPIKKYKTQNWLDLIKKYKTPLPLYEFIIPTAYTNLISSHLDLIDIDMDLYLHISNPENMRKDIFVILFSLLKKEFELMSNKYDIVLFDCPPNFGIITRMALVASDFYLVPTKMDYLSTLGINQLKTKVKSFTNKFNRYSKLIQSPCMRPKMLGVIATMISMRGDAPIGVHKNYMGQLMMQNIDRLDTTLRENKSLYGESPESGIPLVMKNDGNIATQELKDLGMEIIKKARI